MLFCGGVTFFVVFEECEMVIGCRQWIICSFERRGRIPGRRRLKLLGVGAECRYLAFYYYSKAIYLYPDLSPSQCAYLQEMMRTATTHSVIWSPQFETSIDIFLTSQEGRFYKCPRSREEPRANTDACLRAKLNTNRAPLSSTATRWYPKTPSTNMLTMQNRCKIPWANWLGKWPIWIVRLGK